MTATRESTTDENISSRLARYLHFETVNRDYLAWQLAQFEPYIGQRVLEVGVGVGTIVDLLGPRELIHGLDVEEDVLEYTRQRFADRVNYSFDLQDITTLSADKARALGAMKLDTVVCINVLEHIENDGAATRQMAELLTPGGHLLLLVPAHEALFGKYDVIDGHFRRYSRAMIRRVVERSGLEALHIYYFNALGALGWWYQYKLRRREIHGSDEFGIMNRILPAVRVVENTVRPPFGLSVVAVCRKPD